MSNPPVPPDVKIDAQLYEGLNKLLKDFSKNKELICDTNCRENQKLDALYQDYQDWLYVSQESAGELQKAERDYYVTAKGTQWYSTFRENVAKDQVSQIIPVISENMTEKYNEIVRYIDYYQSQISYIGQMEDQLQTLTAKIANLTSQINNLDSKTNVAHRLTSYYDTRIQDVNWWLYYLIIIYWIIGAVLLCGALWKIYQLWRRRKIAWWRDEGPKRTKLLVEAGSIIGYFVLPFLMPSIIVGLNPTQCRGN